MKHEKITVRNKCQWRTLKPQGNTGPMRPAKGNSPGEAELSNGPTECGETAAGAAEPSPRGWNAPLGELTTSTAFPRKVIRRRTRSRTAGRRDGGTAGRRDNGMTGRRDGGTVGRWDGATVEWRYSGTAGWNGWRLWSGGGVSVLKNTEGGGLWTRARCAAVKPYTQMRAGGIGRTPPRADVRFSFPRHVAMETRFPTGSVRFSE